uniref:Uncharacterized protein n=1 Tax=Timema bartmani TaxID=61472 RepID=A0A7R9ERY4_9NEOP|nr:unnamed protein product [Timema bartmani]
MVQGDTLAIYWTANDGQIGDRILCGCTGQCTWSNVTGRMVTLADTTLLQMTEVERRVMQKVALAKLQALNLGVTVRIPSDAVGNSTAHKPKRRAYLLKRKALTTGFFDTARGKDGDKDKGNRHSISRYLNHSLSVTMGMLIYGFHVYPYWWIRDLKRQIHNVLAWQ